MVKGCHVVIKMGAHIIPTTVDEKRCAKYLGMEMAQFTLLRYKLGCVQTSCLSFTTQTAKNDVPGMSGFKNRKFWVVFY